MLTRGFITKLIVASLSYAAISAASANTSCPRHLTSNQYGHVQLRHTPKSITLNVSTLATQPNQTYTLSDMWLTRFDKKLKAYHSLQCDYVNLKAPESIGFHLSGTGYFQHKSSDTNFTDYSAQKESICEDLAHTPHAPTCNIHAYHQA